MARGSVNISKFDMQKMNFDAFLQVYRQILYLEIEQPRYSSLHDAFIHFFMLSDGKLSEYEIKYSDAEQDYRSFLTFLDRYIVADFYRSYRFQTPTASYRVLVRKGIQLDANNDLGGFVYQNNKTSLLISPRRREVFERLQSDMIGHTDGTAQLVRVGLLLKNEKFVSLHEEYFGKIGIAALKDGSTIKCRYADSIANNSVVTDENIFKEYLDRVNAISMSDFTKQSIISQLVDDFREIKRILMENYCNFLFLSEDEIDLACTLLALFLHAMEFNFSTEDWVMAVNYVRYLNDDTFLRLDEQEADYKRELGFCRARYVLENVSLPKLVHFLYDFFDYKNLSQNVGAFYPRLKALLGEDIRDKFSHLETVNVSLKSFQEAKNPCDFFKYPQLVNFATSADKEIQKQIISGEYDHNFAAFYLCNYMQVADYKSYADVLPAVVGIIKNLEIKDENDFNLFWMACDVLNEFWKELPKENAELQVEIEKLICGLFWQRIGDIWPIEHRAEIKYENKAKEKAFKESLSWILTIDSKLYNPKLKKYLKSQEGRDNYDISDYVDKHLYYRAFAKKKTRTFAEFMTNHADDFDWIYAGVCCDDIGDEDIIINNIFNFNSTAMTQSDARKFALEKWLLRGHSAERFDSIRKIFIDGFDRYLLFCREVTDNENKMVEYIYCSIAAMCESATNEGEDEVIKAFAKKAMAENVVLASDYREKIERMIAVAKANIRQANFQYKNIDAAFVRKLY